ncbi:MAG: hypothetical protein WKF70_10770, partial [Chitinophagaceae bacterium]
IRHGATQTAKDSALKALDFAVQIAKSSKAEIVLLHACTDMLDTEAKATVRCRPLTTKQKPTRPE